MLIEIEEDVYQGIIDLRRLDDQVRIITSEYDIRVWPDQEGIPSHMRDKTDLVGNYFSELVNRLLDGDYVSVTGLRHSSGVRKVNVISK